MVAEDITKPVAEDSCGTISRIPMSHSKDVLYPDPHHLKKQQIRLHVILKM